MAGAGTTTTPRERYRAQVQAEVKERAWEQIAEAGASALSLNAIAKRMGMTGPALYRYFAGRDELITELIRDAYRSLADTLRAAAEGGSGSGGGAGAEVVVLAHAVRGWALADPQRYFLIYGTPVPGYHAPDDVNLIASEIMATLLGAWTAPTVDGPTGPYDDDRPGTSSDARPSGGPSARFDAHLADHRDWAAGHPAPTAALHRALSFWTRMHGVLSLELAGHFTGMGFDSAQFYEAELADLLGGAPV